MNKKENRVILVAMLISFAFGYCAKKEPTKEKKVVVFETIIEPEYVDECRPD